MTHHLDTVTARSDGRLNLTDLYVFAATDHRSTVFVLDTCPDAGKGSPTTLHPAARYDITIAPAGSYRAENRARAAGILTLRVLPAEPAGAEQQVTVVAVRDAAAPVPLATGRSGQVLPLDGGGRAWVGPAADPFAADAVGYFSVLEAVHQGRAPDLGALGRGGNFVEGRNVVAMVLELPNDRLPPGPAEIWAAITVLGGGEEKQVSRWGLPNVHAHIARSDEEFDEINAGHPATDIDVWGDRARRRIAATVTAAGTSADPEAYARLLTSRLFPQVLPYSIGTPARFGLFGINGRALHDDAIDVALSHYLDTGIDDHIAPLPAGPTFPYLQPPHGDNDLPPLVG